MHFVWCARARDEQVARADLPRDPGAAHIAFAELGHTTQIAGNVRLRGGGHISSHRSQSSSGHRDESPPSSRGPSLPQRGGRCIHTSAGCSIPRNRRPSYTTPAWESWRAWSESALPIFSSSRGRLPAPPSLGVVRWRPRSSARARLVLSRPFLPGIPRHVPRERELKRGAGAIVRGGPESSVMPLHDGTAYRKAHAEPARLGRVKGGEHLLHP